MNKEIITHRNNERWRTVTIGLLIFIFVNLFFYFWIDLILEAKENDKEKEQNKTKECMVKGQIELALYQQKDDVCYFYDNKLNEFYEVELR